jgi:spore germination protein KA
MRVTKLLFIILGATMGLSGIAAAFVILVALLCNQESFGIPMLSVQAVRWSGSGSLLWQRPVWMQKLRPRELKAQKESQYPKKPRQWEES